MRYKSKFIFLDLFEYIFALFILLDCNSVWHASVESDYHFDMICASLSIVLFLLTKKYFKIKASFSKETIVLFILCFIYLCLTFNQTTKLTFVPMFLLGLPFLLNYFSMSILNRRGFFLFYKLQNIVVLLSLSSVILWLLGPLTDILRTDTSIRINWGYIQTYKGYFSLLYNIQLEDGTFLNSYLYRNTSIFTEGPMFNLWLIIALLVEFFMRKKVSIIKIVLLTLTLLTTFSTTGFIALFLFMVLKLYSLGISSGSKFFSLVKYPLLFVGIAVGYVVVMYIIELKSDTGSYSLRMDGYAIAFALWLMNPLLGLGYGNLHAIFMESTSLNIGFSNSIFAILATGGLWMTCIILYPFLFNLFVSIYRNRIWLLSFVVISLYLIVTTIFYARFLLVVLVAFQYANLLTFNSKNKHLLGHA